jgi:hypothetical protein
MSCDAGQMCVVSWPGGDMWCQVGTKNMAAKNNGPFLLLGCSINEGWQLLDAFSRLLRREDDVVCS